MISPVYIKGYDAAKSAMRAFVAPGNCRFVACRTDCRITFAGQQEPFARLRHLTD